MANLSNIITPTNVLTATSTNTVTNKTINASNNTLTNVSLTTAVTGTLPVANGGTGAATLTANNVLLGNGTSALQAVAPGTSGNVLTSNGTAWTSAAPAGGITFTVKSANYTAVAGDNILANTSAGSFTITLPASPSTGSVINISDSGGRFQLFPLTVARNGKTIMGLSEDLFVSNNSASFGLAYNGSTWRII